MVRVDDTFEEGKTSYWCVTDEIFQIGLEWNNKFNNAWGVEMRMWPIEAKPLQANEQTGSGPGGWITDSAGNSFKWDAKGFEIGSAGKGTLVIREDEIAIKMRAIALALSVMSGIVASMAMI